MSFATNGMKQTRSGRSAPAPQAVQGTQSGFSNVGIIDYKHAINFSNMLAAQQSDSCATTKQYNVNLDAQGHTINMQLQPKTPSPLVSNGQQVFLSTDQIADVASRIASEMCSKSVSEPAAARPAAALPAEDLSPVLAQQLKAMQQRIDHLQNALKFDDPIVLATAQAPPALVQGTASAAGPATPSIEAGLRHHASVLRATQDKLDALEADMSQLMATAAEHADSLLDMDVGLRNQKSEIENAHECIRDHAGRLDVSDEQMMLLSSDVDQRQADRLHFEARCKATVASLRTDFDATSSATSKMQSKYAKMSAGLQNHKEEILSMRSMNSSSEAMHAATERRIADLSSGLDNHRQAIRMLKSDASSAASGPMMLAKLERLDDGLEEHRGELRAMRASMSSEAHSSSNSVLTHLQLLDTNLEQHKTEIRSLKAAMGRGPCEANVAALSAGLQNHKSEIRSMRSTLAHNEQQLGSLQTAGEPVTAQLLAMQTRLDAMQSAMQATPPQMSHAPQTRATPSLHRTDLSAFLERRPVR